MCEHCWPYMTHVTLHCDLKKTDTIYSNTDSRCASQILYINHTLRLGSSRVSAGVSPAAQKAALLQQVSGRDQVRQDVWEADHFIMRISCSCSGLSPSHGMLLTFDLWPQLLMSLHVGAGDKSARDTKISNTSHWLQKTKYKYTCSAVFRWLHLKG